MELYRLERYELPYWLWVLPATVLVFAAVVTARRKQPFYGRLIGAGLLLVLPFIPVDWLHSSMIVPAVMMLVLTLDCFIDRSQKPIARAAFGIAGVVLFTVFLRFAYNDSKSYTFVWRVSETSLRQENLRHETVAQVSRDRTRILESGRTPDRDWIVKDGSGQQLEAREYQTYLDKNNGRIPAEEIVRRIETWTGKPRERK